MKKSIRAITTAGLILIMLNIIITDQNVILKSSSNSSVKNNPVVVTPTAIITAVKTIVQITDTFNISTDYHKQMDAGEYTGDFLPSLRYYFNGADVRYNFCGVMTVLNVMDILQGYNSITAVELVNKYFVDEKGDIAMSHEGRGTAFRASNGSMSPSSLYWMADKIGYDTGLWRMAVVYGSTNFILIQPIKKSDLSAVVDKAKTEVFANNGVIIAHVGIASAGQFSYWHFIVIEDMKISISGDLELLIVDSMGYYGWVNANDYLVSAEPYNSDIFTGIVNLYGVIPNR